MFDVWSRNFFKNRHRRKLKRVPALLCYVLLFSNRVHNTLHVVDIASYHTSNCNLLIKVPEFLSESPAQVLHCRSVFLSLCTTLQVNICTCFAGRLWLGNGVCYELRTAFQLHSNFRTNICIADHIVTLTDKLCTIVKDDIHLKILLCTDSQ